MRLVPNTDTVPYGVNRYLLPYERSVITIHYHLAILFAPIVLVLGGLAAVLASINTWSFSQDALLIIWLSWGILLLYLIGKVLSWSVSYFVVTAGRMMVVKGIMARDVAMIPLIDAADLRLRRSTMGRVMGYGQFILKSVGQDQGLRTVGFLPYPEQLYLEVCGLIYRDRLEDEESPD